jgi:hemerythrin-like domain-containing protein
MDMVVRLKLDDKETLLVGLKQEGQKVIVDVKSSNDSLVNLIQAHKDDITRHLEDKNIFTSIFVQPDGERNSERQNQQEKKKENGKQQASTSFINILEATA